VSVSVCVCLSAWLPVPRLCRACDSALVVVRRSAHQHATVQNAEPSTAVPYRGNKLRPRPPHLKCVHTECAALLCRLAPRTTARQHIRCERTFRLVRLSQSLNTGNRIRGVSREAMLLIRNYLYKFFLLYTTQMHKKLSHREQIACQRYEWQDGRHNTQLYQMQKIYLVYTF